MLAAGSKWDGFLNGRSALADAVATLAASPSLRREAATAARERILERFDIDCVGVKCLALYEDLQ